MSMMPPQQQDSLDESPLKRRSSTGECSVGRYDAVLSTASTATTPSRDHADGPCRAAEEWLYRGGVSLSRSPLSVTSAAAAEEWLSCGGVSSNPSWSAFPVLSSEVLRRWDRQNSPDRTDSPSSSEVLSSSSSPERTSLRERQQSRLLKEEGDEPLHADATWMALTKAPPPQRDEPLHTLPMWMALTNPPPPPATPHPTPVTPTRKSSADILQYCHVYGNSLDSCDKATKIDRSDEATKNDRYRKVIKNEPNEKKPGTTTAEAVAKIIEALKENDDEQYKAAKANAHASLLRLSRQVRYGTRGQLPPTKTNAIMLHIYDLLPTETIMQLGWGCEFPIGQCFNAVNDGLYELGTGAYHCGIEINGIEYAYGANSTEGTTGVFSCIPKHSPGFEYRTSLDFGSRTLTKTEWVRVSASNKSQSVYREIITYVDGRKVMKEMAKEYLGVDYDLLRKNCCTFARDACVRLGIREDEIPSWFMNLADAGAATQDVAYMTFQPITSMLSYQANDDDDDDDDDDSFLEAGTEESQTGFEVIAKRKEGQKTAMEIVKVVDAWEMEPSSTTNGKGKIDLRRTLSWTY